MLYHVSVYVQGYMCNCSRFMPPDDPLGKHGPTLDNFLRKEPKVLVSMAPVCPYGKKCTYGNKCKYSHPERGSQPHRLVTERLAKESKIRLKEIQDKGSLSLGGKSFSLGGK